MKQIIRKCGQRWRRGGTRWIAAVITKKVEWDWYLKQHRLLWNQRFAPARDKTVTSSRCHTNCSSRWSSPRAREWDALESAVPRQLWPRNFHKVKQLTRWHFLEIIEQRNGTKRSPRVGDNRLVLESLFLSFFHFGWFLMMMIQLCEITERFKEKTKNPSLPRTVTISTRIFHLKLNSALF